MWFANIRGGQGAWWLQSDIALASPLACRIRGEDTRLMLWDTAGQEEFDAITKAYYRGIPITGALLLAS